MSARQALALGRRVLAGAALLGLAAAQAPPSEPNPKDAEVPLPCADGWHASLVIDNGKTGIWTVQSYSVFPQYGAPEIVGLDDRGRCHVLVSYSGKWTPSTVIEDGRWLGALTHGDVDARVPGAELYTGGQNGNLFQVLAHPNGKLDYRQIAMFPGLELHTSVSGDLDPRSPGAELLLFTSPGRLFRIAPTGPDGTFEVALLQELEGRVRDAVVLPAAGPGPAEIATVGRDGKAELLRIGQEGPRWSTIHAASMGKGRVALAPAQPGRATVLYSTQDDGVILRHERAGPDEWRTEPIYLGPQGTRGIAAGRFHADPAVESVAVFGYSARVELLTRGPAGWSVETLFTDRDKGHWLATGELDGRNGTDELIGSGYGGRIFLLARPPGYGRPGIAVDPRANERALPEPPPPPEAERPPRIGVRAGPRAVERLSTLSYGGGFETKTLVYETLVTQAADGSLAPGLARAWRHEDQGATLVLELRPGARFHDGRPVDAAAVREHFQRWVGLPEHAWLPSHGRIQRVVARSELELALELDRPHALLPELCAINPCGVQGPGTFDREGEFTGPVGSGPFRFAGAREEGRVLRYARVADGRELDLVRLGERSPVEALLAGEIDAVADGSSELLPRAELARLASAPEVELASAPGGSVVYLAFRADGGPAAGADVRRAVRAGVDRAALIAAVEGGHADPCRTFAPPMHTSWPAAGAEAPPARPVTLAAPLVLLVLEGDARAAAVAAELARQLAAAGLALEVRPASDAQHAAALRAGAWDLCVESTWGAPYDPHLSFLHRFQSMARQDSAADERAFGVDPRLAALATELEREPEEGRRRAIHARIQALIDAEAVIVPLYAPRRLAAWRPARGTLALGGDPYRLAWRFPGDA